MCLHSGDFWGLFHARGVSVCNSETLCRQPVTAAGGGDLTPSSQPIFVHRSACEEKGESRAPLSPPVFLHKEDLSGSEPGGGLTISVSLSVSLLSCVCSTMNVKENTASSTDPSLCVERCDCAH